jgi:hypothetical protein
MLSPFANLRALQAIRRKITAAYARVYGSGNMSDNSVLRRFGNRGGVGIPWDRSSLGSALPSPSTAHQAFAWSSCHSGAAPPGFARYCRKTEAHPAAVRAPHAHLVVRPTSFR